MHSEALVSGLGLIVFIALAYLFSTDRRAVPWRLVIWGIGLQFVFALIILKTETGFALFRCLGDAVTRFLAFSHSGAKFVFGDNYAEHFIAFQVLPTIIFFSAFINVLYHYGILQRIVRAMAWVMMRTMGSSGTESLACAANIFVGQTEAPLLIKPYLAKLTHSELHAVMAGGFATIAGGVMAAYISFGISAEHLIAASVMSAPAALVIAKLLYPEACPANHQTGETITVELGFSNLIDAVVTGATDGLKLAVNVAAMLIAFLGLLALVNAIIGVIGGWFGLPQLSLEWIFSWLLAPVAWLMGVPWADCAQVGVLLGKKVVLNEFIAYLDLQTLMENSKQISAGKAVSGSLPVISERAQIISIYALCGFANFGSIGVQIGGIGALIPGRRQDLSCLGLRAMLAGMLACFMTATIAGMLL